MAGSHYLARILPWADAAQLYAEHADDENKGWLLVIYKDEVQWARPCYPRGQFTPPTQAWIERHAEKWGVWVAPEMHPHAEEQDDHLVYVGFEPLGGTLPSDVEAGFPKKQLWFTADWEVVVNEDAAAPEVEIRAINPDAPEQPPVRFLLKKVDGTLEVKLAAGSGPDEKTLKLSGVGAQSKLELGDAAKSATIAEAFQTFWGQVKSYIDAHTHQAGSLVAPMGPVTGVTGAPASGAPGFDSAMISSQLKFPANP
jgi:hypothetical protein